MYRKAILIVFVLLVAASAIYALIDHKKVTTSSDSAYEAYLKGEELLRKLYTMDATQEFERAVQLDPKFAMAYARLAMIYKDLGRNDDYKRAKSKAFEFINDVRELERIQIDLTFARADGNNEDIDKYSAELLEKYPKSLEAHEFLSGKYWAMQEIDKAIEENVKLLEIDPQYALAYNMLGYLYYRKGEYDKALEYIDKYSSLAEDQANPHDSNGEISLWLGRYDEAMNQFQIADSIKPNLDFVVFHLGLANFYKGMYRDALGAYLKAKELAINEMKKAEYETGIAECYIFNDQYNEGIEVLNEIVGKHPEYIGPHMRLGIVYVWTGEMDKALIELGVIKGLVSTRSADNTLDKTSKALLSTNIAILEAEIAGARGEYDKSVSIYDAVLSTIPNPDRLFFVDRQGEILIKARKPDRAVAVLTEALKDNPNYPFFLMTLSKAYRDMGQRESEREILQRLLAVYKDADEDFRPYMKARAELDKLQNVS